MPTSRMDVTRPPDVAETSTSGVNLRRMPCGEEGERQKWGDMRQQRGAREPRGPHLQQSAHEDEGDEGHGRDVEVWRRDISRGRGEAQRSTARRVAVGCGGGLPLPLAHSEGREQSLGGGRGEVGGAWSAGMGSGGCEGGGPLTRSLADT